MNVRGLASSLKRKEVFNWLMDKQYDIYCLQDVQRLGRKCYFSIGTSRSRGVAILFREQFTVTVHQMNVYSDGNLLVLDMEIEE